MYKILFVCTGATCRSPMAAALFNKKVKANNISNLKASFCGMNVEYNSSISQFVKIVLKAKGINRVYGSPEQINDEHITHNNMIICLTEDHKIALTRMVADKFVSKIYCFKDFCGYDIPDPFNGDVNTYVQCLKQIDEAENILLDTLLNNKIAKRKRIRNV